MDEWLPANVPGGIHTNLLAARRFYAPLALSLEEEGSRQVTASPLAAAWRRGYLQR